MTPHSKNLFRPTALTLALLALVGSVQAQSTSDLGRVTVSGEGDKLGTGLIVDEDAAKAKSTVTKAQIEKLRPSSSPFQALQHLPGVNTTSTDATGLFGGTLRVRGFNSDQMGFTVNGAPLNDSGNFAVFPQEYVDSENLCELYVTQGATENDAPHVGASGGNVGIATCAAFAKPRLRFSQSLGQLDFRRTYVRVDTGLIGNFKSFVSVSKAEVDKWKGKGGANRLHVDAAADYQIGESNIGATLLYNKAVNNNFQTQTLQAYATRGYFSDYATTPPAHATPVAGTAQAETAPLAYYGYALNPFDNYLLSGKAGIVITPAFRIDVEPYYWYGYGTGGVQHTTLGETSGTNRLGGGILDINGDGDRLDTVAIYRGSLTQTNRPGVTTKFSYTLPGHRILAGFWYERARHRQTAPGVRFFNDGRIDDLWLSDQQKLIHRQDGTIYQNRDQMTISTGKAVFLQDTIDLLDNKLVVIPGVSWRQINRDYTNYANEGTNQGANYQISESFSKLLPSLGITFKPRDDIQLVAGVSRNFRVPSNFEYQGSVRGGTYVNGALTGYTLQFLRVKPESTWNVDGGVRYKGSMFKAHAIAFYSKFKDRISSSFDPVTQTSNDTNVGPSTAYGLELELGTVPVAGFSAYVSGTYTRSKIEENLRTGATTFAPTAGKQFPDTPKGMAALALQWSQGPYLVNLTTKYNSPRTMSLTNDFVLPGYTITDLNLAYQLPNFWIAKAPIIRVNVSNITDKRYYYGNLGSGSQIAVNGSPTITTIANGAPRFASVTFQADY